MSKITFETLPKQIKKYENLKFNNPFYDIFSFWTGVYS